MLAGLPFYNQATGGATISITMPKLTSVAGSLEISGSTQFYSYDVGYISSVTIGNGLSASSPSGLQVAGMIRIGTNVNLNTNGVNVGTPVSYVGIFNLQSAPTIFIACTDGTIASVEVWGWRNQLSLVGTASSTHSGTYTSTGLTVGAVVGKRRERGRESERGRERVCVCVDGWLGGCDWVPHGVGSGLG